MCLKLFHSSMVSGGGSVASPKDQTRLNMLSEVRGGVVVALAQILIRSDTFKNAVKEKWSSMDQASPPKGPTHLKML